MLAGLLHGAKRLADGVRMGGGNFQECLGGTARAAGVLLPFVQRLGTDAEGLCELHLGQAKGSADIADFVDGGAP